MKVANVQLIQRERPDLSQVVTWNAEVNAHMVAVNEQLGFEPVERLGEFHDRRTRPSRHPGQRPTPGRVVERRRPSRG